MCRNDYERTFDYRWPNQSGNLQTNHIIDDEKPESLKERCETRSLKEVPSKGLLFTGERAVHILLSLWVTRNSYVEIKLF